MSKPLYRICRSCGEPKPATDRPTCKACAAHARWDTRQAVPAVKAISAAHARPYRRPSELSEPRPVVREPDVDGPDEAERIYTPEERLALTVFYQAVADLTQTEPRARNSAAAFLVAQEPYRDVHAFWCGLLGVDPHGAVESVMRKHGTQIARVRSWATRQVLARS